MLSTGILEQTLLTQVLAEPRPTCNAFNGLNLPHLEKTMKKLIAALITSMFAVGAFAADAPAAASVPVAASAPAKKATKKHHHKKAKKAAAAASAASK